MDLIVNTVRKSESKSRFPTGDDGTEWTIHIVSPTGPEDADLVAWVEIKTKDPKIAEGLTVGSRWSLTAGS